MWFKGSQRERPKKNKNEQPFFEKFLIFLRNKQPFFERFLIFLRNKPAFSKSPHAMSEVPPYSPYSMIIRSHSLRVLVCGPEMIEVRGKRLCALLKLLRSAKNSGPYSGTR